MNKLDKVALDRMFNQEKQRQERLKMEGKSKLGEIPAGTPNVLNIPINPAERFVLIKFDSLTGNLNISGSQRMQFMEQLNLINMAHVIAIANFVKGQISQEMNAVKESGSPIDDTPKSDATEKKETIQ